MIALRDWTRVNLACLVMLALTSAWALSIGLRAARLDPLPAAAPPHTPSPAYPHSSPVPMSQTAAVLAAVRANPMRPDRRRADGRYGQEPAEAAEPESRAPVPAFRLVGIVQRRSGPDLAAIAGDRSPAQLVRQGGEIHGFVLQDVRSDSVFLARQDTVVGLAVPGRRYRELAD
jgi:hypothetical protein